MLHSIFPQSRFPHHHVSLESQPRLELSLVSTLFSPMLRGSLISEKGKKTQEDKKKKINSQDSQVVTNQSYIAVGCRLRSCCAS
jgi:hypothetical protein